MHACEQGVLLLSTACGPGLNSRDAPKACTAISSTHPAAHQGEMCVSVSRPGGARQLTFVHSAWGMDQGGVHGGCTRCYCNDLVVAVNMACPRSCLSMKKRVPMYNDL
jgi:hypothetical protein